jgi:FkbM family methyltransferase
MFGEAHSSMDFALNPSAAFTKWVVNAELLAEPFVLIDVGVQGGETIRWGPLGDYLTVHGFDPIVEVIDQLKQTNAGHPNRHYHCIAIGNADGEEPFYYNAANPTASSLYQQGSSRYLIQTTEQVRMVPMRRLDSLFAEGLIPKADFLKVDVEGHEKDVLLGAGDLFRAGMLGMHAETNFGTSPLYPKSHFGTMAEFALDNHLLVFDLAFDRMPRASFQKALIRKGLEPIVGHDEIGKPTTVDVLFCRDLIDEVDHQDHYVTACRPTTIDQIIKMMIICELHSLNDIALDMAERFAERLGARFDVDRAIWLLADPDIRPNEYKRQIKRLVCAYEQSTSWRITAPLRWIKLMLVGGGRDRAHNRSNGRTHRTTPRRLGSETAHDYDEPRSSGQGIAQ